ncbi:MAG: hypothetical protein QXM38_01555 [Candidatus Aenigmatarchaeota archaeon]
MAMNILEFIGLLIFVGAIIFIIRLLMGNVIKIEVEKENFVLAGKATNIANVIINSEEIVSADELLQPKKGVINKTKLVRLSGKNEPLQCCDYIDYDYYVEINIKGEESYYLGYPINKLKDLLRIEKKCNALSEYKNLKTYKFPVVVEDINEIEPAYMYVFVAKTPLSNIATEILVACQQKKYESDFVTFGFNKNDLHISKNGDYYQICIKTQGDLLLCKKFYCEKHIKTREFSKCIDNDNQCQKDCSYFFDKDCKKNQCTFMKVKSENDEVVLCFSENKKELERC